MSFTKSRKRAFIDDDSKLENIRSSDDCDVKREEKFLYAENIINEKFIEV